MDSGVRRKSVLLLHALSIAAAVSPLCAAECPEHYPSGKPEIEIEQLLCKERFAIGYSYTTQTPLWTSEVLEGDAVKKRGAPYKYRFTKDLTIPDKHRAAGFRNCSGRSIYERGQLVPYEDIDGPGSLEAAKEAFLISNVAPQLHEHNAKGWRGIEKAVRKAAVEYGEIEVVTGVIFDYGPDEEPVMVGNGVMVPTHWYKALYAPRQQKMMAWLTPHRAIAKEAIEAYRCRVDTIEAKAEIDLFGALPDLLEAKLEAQP